MSENAQDEIDRLLKRIEQLKTQQSQCRHTWTCSVRADIYVEGFTDPGDRPGTMGIDFRGPCYIPPKHTKRWMRKCTTCGMSQYTTQCATKQVDGEPQF